MLPAASTAALGPMQPPLPSKARLQRCDPSGASSTTTTEPYLPIGPPPKSVGPKMHPVTTIFSEAPTASPVVWAPQSDAAEALPPFAVDRIEELKDGRISYAMKTPRRGRTHRVMTPMEFMGRLA